jgi:cytochrome c553
MRTTRLDGVRYAPIALGVALLLFGIAAKKDGSEEGFEEKLDRVTRALEKNPGNAIDKELSSCARQRRFAIQLHDMQRPVRALRSLDYCLQVLHLSDVPAHDIEVSGPSIQEVEARAASEIEKALGVAPDVAHGLEIFRGCAQCHTPEGAGLASGLVPQIAGQHRTVVIKQLADIRGGNRETILMAPYATVEVIGGVQSVADVASYIETLEISTDVGKGPGNQFGLGERLYAANCARCHGANGEGDAEDFVPRIHAQHYDYLMRQFQRIRAGTRRNADPEMRAQVEGFSDKETSAVLDYVSRLEPPETLRAPRGWKNPDFAQE